MGVDGWRWSHTSAAGGGAVGRGFVRQSSFTLRQACPERRRRAQRERLLRLRFQRNLPLTLSRLCPPIRVGGKREGERHVIPAEAGIQVGRRWHAAWTPAFAGVTKWEVAPIVQSPLIYYRRNSCFSAQKPAALSRAGFAEKVRAAHRRLKPPATRTKPPKGRLLRLFGGGSLRSRLGFG